MVLGSRERLSEEVFGKVVLPDYPYIHREEVG